MNTKHNEKHESFPTKKVTPGPSHSTHGFGTLTIKTNAFREQSRPSGKTLSLNHNDTSQLTPTQILSALTSSLTSFLAKAIFMYTFNIKFKTLEFRGDVLKGCYQYTWKNCTTQSRNPFKKQVEGCPSTLNLSNIFLIERNFASPLKPSRFETSSKSDRDQNTAIGELQPICHEMLLRKRTNFNLLLGLTNKKTFG